jgi:hypothetical protein
MVDRSSRGEAPVPVERHSFRGQLMKGIFAFLMVSLSARLVLGSPTLEEGFEGAAFPPPGWTTQTAGLPIPHAWHRTTDPDYRGSGRASAYVGSGSPGPIDEWLVTPVVTLAATDKTLKFSWSGNPHWSNVLDASLNIREAGATGWTPLWSIAGNESPADPFVYRPRFVDLSAWTGRSVQFGFRVVGTNGASFGLDDIAIGDLAPVSELLFPVDTLCVTPPGHPGPWRVVAVREPWADDVPFETRTPALRTPTDRNYAPGPDSLVARCLTDAKHHPHVVIERLDTGQIDTLLVGWASLPQWSPDGRYVSCVAWRSTREPHQLAVVDIATKAEIQVGIRASGTEAKWSPDSRMIAASGMTYSGSRCLLYVVSIPGGAVAVVDSLDVFASHEFSWSPDGRWIAFSRPTRLHHVGDTTAADLWIADTATGESWCILHGADWVESDPLWITNRSIQVNRVRWNDDGANQEQRVVVELSHSADLHH